MKKPGNILIVDDNRGVLTAVQLLLKPHFEKIITLTSPVTLTSVLREETPSVVLPETKDYSGCRRSNAFVPPCLWFFSLPMEILILPCVA